MHSTVTKIFFGRLFSVNKLNIRHHENFQPNKIRKKNKPM